MRIYGYLRASTAEQDASRAQEQLSDFAEQMGLHIACWFEENESGASLKRPELFHLLDVAQPGDVLLVEQVDRISRLDCKDWETLKTQINQKGIKVVSKCLTKSYRVFRRIITQDVFNTVR